MDANLRARLAELEQRFAQLQEDNDAAVGDGDDDLCEEVGASRDALLHDILLVAEQHGHSRELSSAVGSLLDRVIDYDTNRDGFDDSAPVASEELDSFSSKPVIKASGSNFSFKSMETQAFMLSMFNEFPPSGGAGPGKATKVKGDMNASRNWTPKTNPCPFTSKLSRFTAPSSETTALRLPIAALYPYATDHLSLQSVREARCTVNSARVSDAPLKLHVSPSGTYVAYYTGIETLGKTSELPLGRTTNLDGTKKRKPSFRNVEHGLDGYLQNVLLGLQRAPDEVLFLR